MPAEIENSQMLFRADEIDFDQDTGDVRASGHVFFHNFERNMKMWAGHLTYNTDEETGKFYDVIGETRPHIVAKPVCSRPTTVPFRRRMGRAHWCEIHPAQRFHHQLQDTAAMVAPARQIVRHRPRRARDCPQQHVSGAQHAAVLRALFLPLAGEGAAQERFPDSDDGTQFAPRLDGSRRVLLGDQPQL
jgi:hypothetical protein